MLVFGWSLVNQISKASNISKIKHDLFLCRISDTYTEKINAGKIIHKVDHMYLRNPIQSQTYKDIEYKQVIGANL